MQTRDDGTGHGGPRAGGGVIARHARRSRGALALAAAAALGIAAVIALAVATRDRPIRPTSASIAVIHRRLARHLRARHLSFQQIACVHTGRYYDGARVVRCNVDFGDPHVVAYCSVLRDGALQTSVDDPSIPCRHDDVGWSAPIRTFG